MWLFVGGLFDLDLSRRLVNFALEFIAGPLELPEALTDAASEFREFFRTKKEQHDHQNKNNFGPTRHGEGKQWSAHGSLALVHELPECNPILVFISSAQSWIAPDGKLGCSSAITGAFTMPTKNEKNPPTLETAMQRVSEIVASMEAGDLPLEKLIESYEEGTALVKMCQEKLDAAEKRIQIIARNARGEVSLEEFDAEAN